MQFILTDIEGTTTSIDFVHKVLFPYSKRQMAQFLEEHAKDPEVRNWINKIWHEDLQAQPNSKVDMKAVEAILQQWIADDIKHPLLKALQGRIWREGYLKGAYTSHFYPEVPTCLKRWQEKGLRLGVYSSGSVEAQKLLFAYSEYGDLTPYMSAYFDTSIGQKRDSTSYQRISEQLRTPSDQILFLSDIAGELDAATVAGMQTCQLLRPGTSPSPGHNQACDFREVAQKFNL